MEAPWSGAQALARLADLWSAPRAVADCFTLAAIGAGDHASITLLLEGLLLLALLGASAFFSGSETALFALKDAELDEFAQDDRRRRRQVVELVDHPQPTLVTLLFGNMLVNVGISVLATSVSLRLFGDRGLVIAIPAATLLLLLFGEIVPKSAGLRRRRLVAEWAAPTLGLLVWILRPVHGILVAAIEWSIGTPSNRPLQVEELPTAVSLAAEEGELTAFEAKVFTRMLGFAPTPIGRCMTPRVDMVTASSSARREELLATFEKSGRSRLPVTGEGLDDVVGVLYLKDVVARRTDEDFTAAQLMREALFEPEALPAGELMRRFQERQVHLAIVVGEHGGVEGMVTMEDLLEELVGEIRDEADDEERVLESVAEGIWRGDAGLELDGVRETLGDVADFDYDGDAVTLSGFLEEELGRVPQAGDVVHHGRWRLRVLSASPNRPRLVQIRWADEESGS
jgi:putative hemolysin